MKINWPTAAVAMVLTAAAACVLLFGRQLGMSEELHTQMTLGALAFAAVAAATLKPLFVRAVRDEDGDGSIAAVDRDDHDPEVQ